MAFKEVLTTALNNSPAVVSAKKKFESTQLERKNAISVFLPSLDLVAVHGGQGNRPSTYAIPTASSTSLTLTENLYDNGQSITKLKIADYNLRVSETQLKGVRGKLLVTVSGLYFDYCVANNRLKFAEKNQQQLEKQLNLAREQFHQGVKTRKDFVSFQAQTQRGAIDLLYAKNNLAKTRKSLLEGMGLNAATDQEVNPEFNLRLTIKDLPTEVAGISLREEDLLNLKREVSELQVKLSKRKNLPQLDLTASAGYGSSNYINSGSTWADGEKTNWSVLLTLNWNLIDFGQRSRNVALTRLQQDIEQQDLRISLLSAQKELENFEIDLKNFAKNYDLVKNLKKMEEDNFKLLEGEYRQGKVSYLELLTAMTNLLDAQYRDTQADFDLHRLWLKRKFYEGNLDENVFEN